MTTKSNKCSLIPTSGESSGNRKDLEALTLSGPTRDNPVLDPLAVLHLDNRLYLILNMLYRQIITAFGCLNVPSWSCNLDALWREEASVHFLINLKFFNRRASGLALTLNRVGAVVSSHKGLSPQITGLQKHVRQPQVTLLSRQWWFIKPISEPVKGVNFSCSEVSKRQWHFYFYFKYYDSQFLQVTRIARLFSCWFIACIKTPEKVFHL